MIEAVMKSESLSQLFTALSVAQGKIKSATKDSTNPHFKSSYADLASVWDACRDPLTENGLCVVQLPTVSEGRVNVLTILGHKSGEFIGCNLSLKPMRDDPQGDGSAITYARRYGLSAVAGIAPDDDDDGNEASRKPTNGHAAEPKRDRPPFTPAAEQPAANGSFPKQIGLTNVAVATKDGEIIAEQKKSDYSEQYVYWMDWCSNHATSYSDVWADGADIEKFAKPLIRKSIGTTAGAVYGCNDAKLWRAVKDAVEQETAERITRLQPAT